MSIHVRRMIGVLALSNLLSVFLFMLRVMGAGNARYWFMLWNLLLAWLPVLFVIGLRRGLARKWPRYVIVALAGLWLIFLPNSFYMVSDLIHLKWTGEINILFDAVMFFSFIVNGFIAGYLSVYLVHRELLKRLDNYVTTGLLAVAFFLCGFAIYLGRSLRWNSWDVVANPAGVLFDVSDGIINPLEHPQIVLTTLTFFLLIGTLYAVVYETIGAAIATTKQRKPTR